MFNCVVGSSPRMRGTPNIRPLAGKGDGDHPRACGEHSEDATKAYEQAGSSPRMRGTRGYAARARTLTGIIPAHAGNTRTPKNSTNTSTDHPRACGEHRKSTQKIDTPTGSSPRMRGTRGPEMAYNDTKVGSSPRMRGTRGMRASRLSRSGIIPAHAGNTLLSRSAVSMSRDHPRACGEHYILV